jgi:predicted nucleic acid-binding protein
VNGFLLDTNVISELVKPKPNHGVIDWIDNADESSLYLSVITLGEIRKGIASRDDLTRKARIESWFRALVDRFADRFLPIGADIAERWGRLAGDFRRRGISLPVIDGLLAATALQHDLTFVTRNIKDVRATGVESLDPWIS